MKATSVRRYSITHDQSFIHLSVIQTVSLGIPVITVGFRLAEKYGAGVAICSILIGNLILWLIAMTISSMAIEDRSNAVENVKEYLGKYGAFFMVLVLLIAFLNWFVLQINTSIPSIGHYFGIEKKDGLVRLGAGIGFFTALVSIGGIRIIKWITTVSFPIVFCYYIFAVLQSNYSLSSAHQWGVALPAVLTTILVLLPGVVNLPTFFRHARTKSDCYLALTIMTLVISFFEIATIWMTFVDGSGVIGFGSTSSMFSLATLLFIFISLVTTNLLNIYYASACWECFAPKFEGAKGYAIVGLIGTAAYTFIQIYTQIQFLEDLANCYIASLGVVLLIAFLVRTIVRHRPRSFQKLINGFCWLVGCLVGTLTIIKNTHDGIDPLLTSVAWSALVFLCIIFMEETIWAIRKIFNTSQTNLTR